MEDLPASHPLYGSEQSKSGFGICYQFAIKCPVSALRPQCFQGFAGFVSYSHSLRLNALCVIYVYLIPSGDSDSLRHSYSTACTASGYHFVISVITGETVLL